MAGRSPAVGSAQAPRFEPLPSAGGNDPAHASTPRSETWTVSSVGRVQGEHHRLDMGAAHALPPDATDSPLADEASRQREITVLRETVNALRDPAGAVRLAVQLLAGPLRSAIRDAQAQEAARVTEVLAALETATAELTRLLSPLGPLSAAPPANVIPLPRAALGPEALVAAVRQGVRQRCQLPATLETTVEPGARPAAATQDLQVALVGLVENAMESMARRRPQGAPWTVELRVSLEPAEELGDEMHVVFDVRDRGDGLPAGVRRWLEDPTGAIVEASPSGPGMSLQLARRVAEGCGGVLVASRVGGGTRMQLRVPHR